MNKAYMANITKKTILLNFICVVLSMTVSPATFSQQSDSIYQNFAPIDLTGNWVSVVTEDWHIRMIPPLKGNFEGLPLTRRAQEIADSADIEKLEMDGEACQAYGAARLLREPGRLKVSWEDEDTLRIDTDAGEQTRFLHFESGPDLEVPSLQGFSLAEWQYVGGFDPDRVLLNPEEANIMHPIGGKLYVQTDNLEPSMLRKNGVPLSSETTLKEYFNTLREPNGTEWMIVTTIVRDPINLLVEYVYSANFKREESDEKWMPSPCTLIN